MFLLSLRLLIIFHYKKWSLLSSFAFPCAKPSPLLLLSSSSSSLLLLLLFFFFFFHFTTRYTSNYFNGHATLLLFLSFYLALHIIISTYTLLRWEKNVAHYELSRLRVTERLRYKRYLNRRGVCLNQWRLMVAVAWQPTVHVAEWTDCSERRHCHSIPNKRQAIISAITVGLMPTRLHDYLSVSSC